VVADPIRDRGASQTRGHRRPPGSARSSLRSSTVPPRARLGLRPRPRPRSSASCDGAPPRGRDGAGEVPPITLSAHLARGRGHGPASWGGSPRRDLPVATANGPGRACDSGPDTASCRWRSPGRPWPPRSGIPRRLVRRSWDDPRPRVSSRGQCPRSMPERIDRRTPPSGENPRVGSTSRPRSHSGLGMRAASWPQAVAFRGTTATRRPNHPDIRPSRALRRRSCGTGGLPPPAGRRLPTEPPCAPGRAVRRSCRC